MWLSAADVARAIPAEVRLRVDGEDYGLVPVVGANFDDEGGHRVVLTLDLEGEHVALVPSSRWWGQVDWIEADPAPAARAIPYRLAVSGS